MDDLTDAELIAEFGDRDKALSKLRELFSENAEEMDPAMMEALTRETLALCNAVQSLKRRVH